ncbi:MAG: IMP dehydrogenase [Candidatus Hatepunaea meridiana]|nr:IMP dehydrogenase [Candidatus Hatepunaea meridiana]
MNKKIIITESDNLMKIKSDKLSGTGLTFDDVLIVPDRSAVLPRHVNLETRITRNIKLKIPLVSAAMDTVTESELAIAIAREGGMGIIHKNLSYEEQAAQVNKVKRSESYYISEPVTLPPDVPLSRALEVMHSTKITGIPIVTNEKLVGILTHRDIRFAEDTSLPISDYMTRDSLVTAPVGTSLEKAKEILHYKRIEKLPVVDEEGKLVGLITAKDIQKKLNYPNACMDDNGRLRVGAAVGVASGTLDRVAALVEAGVDLITVDTAHGHSEGVLRTVREIKTKYQNIDVLAGNIATASAAKDLMDCGVDGVKVGIGAGAICTTRVIAGIGVPQVTAVLNCAETLAGTGIPIIADGGIRYSGDIAKSIAAGADAVMIGSLFAGMEESPGELILWEGRTYKVYYGMGSIAAMKKGSADRYFQEGAEPDKLVPEGIEGRVPFRGKLSDTIFQLIGGIRAAMGYCGCPDINSFKENTRFIRITASGIRESHPHDVVITRESPNYNISL